MTAKRNDAKNATAFLKIFLFFFFFVIIKKYYYSDYNLTPQLKTPQSITKQEFKYT